VELDEHLQDMAEEGMTELRSKLGDMEILLEQAREEAHRHGTVSPYVFGLLAGTTSCISEDERGRGPADIRRVQQEAEFLLEDTAPDWDA
jgi:hypothetical protein